METRTNIYTDGSKEKKELGKGIISKILFGI
jgi:hypothetical protein